MLLFWAIVKATFMLSYTQMCYFRTKNTELLFEDQKYLNVLF